MNETDHPIETGNQRNQRRPESDTLCSGASQNIDRRKWEPNDGERTPSRRQESIQRRGPASPSTEQIRPRAGKLEPPRCQRPNGEGSESDGILTNFSSGFHEMLHPNILTPKTPEVQSPKLMPDAGRVSLTDYRTGCSSRRTREWERQPSPAPHHIDADATR